MNTSSFQLTWPKMPSESAEDLGMELRCIGIPATASISSTQEIYPVKTGEV